MASSDAKREIEALRAEIRAHDQRYYVDAAPTISDVQYDQLLQRLIDLEAAHPQWLAPDSPTQRVGGAPIDGFQTVDHALPMLSIDNTYDLDDLQKWTRRCFEVVDPQLAELSAQNTDLDAQQEQLKGQRTAEAKATRAQIAASRDQLRAAQDEALAEGEQQGYPIPGGYFTEPKVDGVAISLRYEQGRFVQALTRGDGQRGDDVTQNVRTVRSVPLKISGSAIPSVVEIRGEIFMPDAEFRRINGLAEQAGEEPFANPRNATAGTLKQLDPRAVAERRLQFVAHGRGETSEVLGLGFSEFAEQMKSWGVPVSPLAQSCPSLHEVTRVIEQFDQQREELGYGVDGVVVKVERFDLQEQLGYRSRAPRWCIAYKYAAEQAETTLLDVQWQVGKTGKLTPRATMEPVFVAGTTVQHATLHNFGEVQRKDIRVGDAVIIEKAGEIIPQVVRVVEKKRPKKSRPITPPEACPECAGDVEAEHDAAGKETARFCINPECPAQLRERLEHFAGRGQMDIDGMGEKVIAQLLEAGLLKSFGDIFLLHEHRDAVLALPRMGEKKADNLFAGVEAAKGRGLARVLTSLGIRHVGAASSRIIAAHYQSIDRLLAAAQEEIQTFQVNGNESGIGEEIAKSLHHFLHSRQGQRVIGELREAGVTLTEEQDGPTVAGDGLLAGKTLVVTGKLVKYKRDEIEELIRQHGGRAASGVSKATDYLVAGEKAGSKLAKANQLGVDVITEDQFESLLSGAG